MLDEGFAYFRGSDNQWQSEYSENIYFAVSKNIKGTPEEVDAIKD